MTVIWLFYLFGLCFAEITIKIRFEEHSNAMALVFILNWFKRPYFPKVEYDPYPYSHQDVPFLTNIFSRI